MKVLVTGARAPVALEWVRLLGRSGHEVYCADCTRFPLAASSRYSCGYLRFPAPAERPGEFRDWWDRVEPFDLILPTCEEIFWLARAGVPCFAPDFELLRRCHHKGDFIALARSLGLGAPDSRPYDRPVSNPNEFVFKPSYSRWASRCLLPQYSEIPPPDPNWLMQEHLSGTEVSSYGVAWAGRLLGLVCYPKRFAAFGATMVLEPREYGPVTDWVRTFVEKTGFHGQIAFDFILQGDKAMAIECNPRATSGIHLLGQHPNILGALLGGETLQPSKIEARQLRLAALLYAGAWSQWRVPDIVHSWSDPLPSGFQVVSLAELYWLSHHAKVSFTEASTLGIAYDGEPTNSGTRG